MDLDIETRSKYFSHWLFLWFLLYISRIIPYNPTFALLFAQIMITSFSSILFTNYCLSTKHKLEIIIECLLFKFVPLWFLWYNKNMRINSEDLYFTIGISLFYAIYMNLFQKTSIFEIYRSVFMKHICEVNIRNVHE